MFGLLLPDVRIKWCVGTKGGLAGLVHTQLWAATFVDQTIVQQFHCRPLTLVSIQSVSKPNLLLEVDDLSTIVLVMIPVLQ